MRDWRCTRCGTRASAFGSYETCHAEGPSHDWEEMDEDGPIGEADHQTLSHTVILGNDGVHEWGTVYNDDGTIAYNFCENLVARREMTEQIIRELRHLDWFVTWRENVPPAPESEH